jgi:hypothetical protein
VPEIPNQPPKISDKMIETYEDTETWARVSGFKQGLKGWPLRQYQVREGLAAVFAEIWESAYRAGREDAARDIEESTAEDLDLPAWARPGGRPPPERLQEWAAYIGLRAWAASIARGTDRPTPRQGSGVVQPVEERQPE